MSMFSHFASFQIEATRKWSVVLPLKKNHKWEEAISLQETFWDNNSAQIFQLQICDTCQS